MAPTSFSRAETAALRRLLRKVQANHCFWPDEETMQEAHRTVSMWAPELVVTRSRGDREILLAVYDGSAAFPAGTWHLPGGYNRWPEADIQETVSRIARCEIGTDAWYVRLLGEHKWTSAEHPYGHPLSLYCLCTPQAEIRETTRLRFFRTDQLPVNLVSPHRKFIEEHFRS